MENNEFKNLWKTMEVSKYSEAELNAIVVKSAKKSMHTLYPGWKFKVVLSMFVVGFILWWSFCNASNLWLTAINSFVLLLVMASLIIVYFDKRRMTNYKSDMSVKEWLKSRIDEIDKGIRILKKYRIYIEVGTLILPVGITVAYNYALSGFVINYSLAVALAATLLVLITFRILWKDRYSKVRGYLWSMYEQLGE
jgi:hypothetical protein